jgi:hypothetical protein
LEKNKLVNLIDLFLGAILSIGVSWYDGLFITSPNAIPAAFISFLLSYLVIQLFFFIFPPIRKVMMVLGAPFRYLHVWLHIDKARRIAEKKYGIIEQEPRSLGFWGDNKGNDTKALMSTYFSNSDAFKVASAPFIGAFTLFAFLLLSAPIFAGMGSFGLIFHIYLLFCCFGVAPPSLKDYAFISNGSAVRAGGLNPGYVLWGYFVFAISGYITLQRTGSAIGGFLDGIFFTVIYLGLLVMVSRLSNRKVGKKKKVKRKTTN